MLSILFADLRLSTARAPNFRTNVMFFYLFVWASVRYRQRPRGNTNIEIWRVCDKLTDRGTFPFGTRLFVEAHWK